ncbi:unnamed protein product [Fusarium graminearum]|nr:unnamed protein product [Fusarium graminearum]
MYDCSRMHGVSAPISSLIVTSLITSHVYQRHIVGFQRDGVLYMDAGYPDQKYTANQMFFVEY